MPLTAVLMNDTRGHYHFGCHRVMRAIESNLERRGVRITARSLVRNDWLVDRAFLKAVAACDIIVINGEGTLHHGSRHGEKLLQIVNHPARGAKPVALINAIYQENPSEWRRFLEGVEIISPRDSWSAAALKEATGRDIVHVPDLSMAEGFHPAADSLPRNLLTIGESVLGATSRDLISFSRANENARFLPIVGALKSSKPQHGPALRALREVYIHAHSSVFRLQNRRAIFSKNEFEYVDHLLRSYLHVSGRFHAICFALTTKTPFLALTSNAWKIEALVDDMGIDKSRIVDVSALTGLVAGSQSLAFGVEEEARITRAMAAGVAGANRLFDQIVEVAQTRKAA